MDALEQRKTERAKVLWNLCWHPTYASECVRWIEQEDIDLNYSAESGEPIIYIVVRNRNLILLHKLIEYGVDVNKSNTEGYTALHQACYIGSIEMATLLLNNNANVNAQTKLGETPLHAAIYAGNVDMIYLLIKYNVDISITTKYGNNPIFLLSQNSHDNYSDLVLFFLRLLWNIPEKKE